jgi:hypothetical protein
MYASVNNPKHMSVSPVQDFVNGRKSSGQVICSCLLIIDSHSAPPVLDRSKNGHATLFNPLVWWQGQRAVGNEWDGLTQMALDVLSCPGMF